MVSFPPLLFHIINTNAAIPPKTIEKNKFNIFNLNPRNNPTTPIISTSPQPIAPNQAKIDIIKAGIAIPNIILIKLICLFIENSIIVKTTPLIPKKNIVESYTS